jgi:hypothetical protein
LLVGELVRLDVQNIDIWLGELLRALPNRESYLDIWAQGWFAWTFAWNGLEIKMNPMNRSGPDLLVLIPEQLAYVEVLRIRTDPAKEKEAEISLSRWRENGLLESYGEPLGKIAINRTSGQRRFIPNVKGSIGKINQRIKDKIRQGQNLPIGAAYVVALYHPSLYVEDIEDNIAVDLLELEADAEGGKAAPISAVLCYDGKCLNLHTNPNGESERRCNDCLEYRLRNLVVPPKFARSGRLYRNEFHKP